MKRNNTELTENNNPSGTKRMKVEVLDSNGESIFVLTDHLITYLFLFLPIKDILNTGLASRYLYTLSRDETLWRMLLASHIPGSSAILPASQNKSQSAYLQYLSLYQRNLFLGAELTDNLSASDKLFHCLVTMENQALRNEYPDFESIVDPILFIFNPNKSEENIQLFFGNLANKFRSSSMNARYQSGLNYLYGLIEGEREINNLEKLDPFEEGANHLSLIFTPAPCALLFNQPLETLKFALETQSELNKEQILKVMNSLIRLVTFLNNPDQMTNLSLLENYCNAISLTDLPTELLVYLFGMLPVRSVTNLGLGNRYLHALSRDETLWKKMFTRDFGFNELKKGEDNISHYLSYLYYTEIQKAFNNLESLNTMSDTRKLYIYLMTKELDELKVIYPDFNSISSVIKVMFYAFNLERVNLFFGNLANKFKNPWINDRYRLGLNYIYSLVEKERKNNTLNEVGFFNELNLVKLISDPRIFAVLFNQPFDALKTLAENNNDHSDSWLRLAMKLVVYLNNVEQVANLHILGAPLDITLPSYIEPITGVEDEKDAKDSEETISKAEAIYGSKPQAETEVSFRVAPIMPLPSFISDFSKTGNESVTSPVSANTSLGLLELAATEGCEEVFNYLLECQCNVFIIDQSESTSKEQMICQIIEALVQDAYFGSNTSAIEFLVKKDYSIHLEPLKEIFGEVVWRKFIFKCVKNDHVEVIKKINNLFDTQQVIRISDSFQKSESEENYRYLNLIEYAQHLMKRRTYRYLSENFLTKSVKDSLVEYEVSRLNLPKVSFYIDCGFEINFTDLFDKYGKDIWQEFLYRAVMSRNAYVLEQILKAANQLDGYDFNINQLYKFQLSMYSPELTTTTCLHFALAYEVSLKIINLLLRYGADSNTVDEFGNTPIYYLLNRKFSNGYSLAPIPVAEILINRGAKVDVSDFAFTIMQGRFELACTLLPGLVDKDALKKLPKLDQAKILYTVKNSNNRDMFKFIFDQNMIDIDIFNLIDYLFTVPNMKINDIIKFIENTNKLYASFGEIERIFYFPQDEEDCTQARFSFFDQRKDFNSLSDLKKICQLALLNGKFALLSIYLSCGMKVDFKPLFKINLPLIWQKAIEESVKERYLGLLENLLNASDTINVNKLFVFNLDGKIHNDIQMGYLHVAAWRGDAEMVDILLKAGADINLLDERRHTPLEAATNNDQIKMVEYLIASGAEVNETYFLTALAQNKIAIADILFANISSRVAAKVDLLYAAIESRDLEQLKTIDLDVTVLTHYLSVSRNWSSEESMHAIAIINSHLKDIGSTLQFSLPQSMELSSIEDTEDEAMDNSSFRLG